MSDWLDELHERIAELEAEVKRLKFREKELKALYEHANRQWSLAVQRANHYRKGGGRESGGAETSEGRRLPRTQEERPASAPAGLPETPAAAANPAACSLDQTGFCWIHGRWHDDKAFRKAADKAARKEAKA